MTTLAAVVTTYGHPPTLARVLDALDRSSLRPDLVHVWDNSRVPWPDVPAGVEYGWTGRNIGLPAAIGRGLDRSAGHDLVLVLDDDTVVAPDTVERMVAALGPGIGAVTVPERFTREVDTGEEKLVFPWSPTLLTRAAIDAAGRPLERLFFNWDDWDYARRIRAAGLRIVWADVPLELHSLDRMWDGRLYLGYRNAVWLVTRRRSPHPAVDDAWRHALRVSFRGGANAPLLRRALVAGLLGRLGPPPPRYAPG